jgi:hypothetical protein
MPVLSKFCGIVIRMMYAGLLGPRFHALYGDHELVVGLAPVRLLQGDAPDRVRDLVLRWASLHEIELLNAWTRCQSHQRPAAVAPWHSTPASAGAA